MQKQKALWFKGIKAKREKDKKTTRHYRQRDKKPKRQLDIKTERQKYKKNRTTNEPITRRQ